MRFDLAARVQRPSRRPIDLRPIFTTKAQADDLARIYLRAVNQWKVSIEAIAAAYEQALPREIQTDSIEQAGAVIESVSASLQRLLLILTPELRAWAFRVEKFHRGKWARGVLSGAGVDLTTLLGPDDVQETVEAVLQRNVALVRDVSNQVRGRIADIVFRGFQKQTPTREVAKEMSEAVDMARTRSIRIASDQTVKLASALDRERQRQAGLDHWKWRHSGKLHPRETHKARNGKIYTDETAPADGPGELPYCGCVRQAVIVFDD